MTKYEKEPSPYFGSPPRFGMFADHEGIDLATIAAEYRDIRDDLKARWYGLDEHHMIALPPEVTVPVSNGLPFEAAMYVLGRSFAETSGALVKPRKQKTIFKRRKK